MNKEPMQQSVFVFGSNLAGRHGKGAALTAIQQYGAKYGVGEGLQGNSYAIPTKGHELEVLPLEDIEASIFKLMAFARISHELYFYITRIGSGLAGYDWDKDIRPLFPEILPSNCEFI